MSSNIVSALLHESVSRLAGFLCAHAEGEPVRTLEAIAAVISNRVQGLLIRRRHGESESPYFKNLPSEAIRAQLFISVLDAMEGPQATLVQPADPVLACCLRIARRAMNQALRDPTRGATDFRKLGDPFPETPGGEEGLWIGSYVFFTEVDASLFKISDEGVPSPLALV